MASKRKRIGGQLADLVGTEELIRLRRAIRGADRLEGFVAGVGREWVLVHVFDADMFLDGSAPRGSPICAASNAAAALRASRSGRCAISARRRWSPRASTSIRSRACSLRLPNAFRWW
jgi:hypothetical protein